MAKKAPVSKAAQASKIAKTSSKEKKKWTKGKQKDTVQRAVAVDSVLLARIIKENEKNLCLTKTTIAEKYNLNAGLAQRILDHLCEKGILKIASVCSLVKVYTKNVKVEEKLVEEESVAVGENAGWN
ncbi:hypothetical protein GVAV_000748 [Gurleya vavrai]